MRLRRQPACRGLVMLRDAITKSPSRRRVLLLIDGAYRLLYHRLISRRPILTPRRRFFYRLLPNTGQFLKYPRTAPSLAAA